MVQGIADPHHPQQDLAAVAVVGGLRAGVTVRQVSHAVAPGLGPRPELPGVMGTQASGVEESFAQALLEYPQYTRPQVWEGRAIPDVLASGDHAKVASFRRAESERLTRERRPDLWAKYAARKDGR